MTSGLLLLFTAPVARLGRWDLYRALLGSSLAEMFAPYLDGPVGSGAGCETYPLRIPEGQSVVVNLGMLGQVRLGVQDGLVKLTLPAIVVNDVIAGLPPEAVMRGPEPDPALDGIMLALRPHPGMRITIPIKVGELVIEVGA